MPRKIKGLRQRLVVALLIPLLLIVGVSLLLDYRIARQTTDSAHDQALADAVFDLETHIRDQADSERFDLTKETEAMLRSDAPDKLYFSVRDHAGKLLAGDDDLPDFAEPEGKGIGFLDGTHHGVAVRAALYRLAVPRGSVLITVMETTEKRQRSRQRILTAMLLPNLAVVLATLLAVLFGVRQGLLPLEAVEREIATRSPDDLREIDLEAVPREIQPTLRRLNELFALLRAAAEAQKRFIADAAHQLRTPLAGLQTQLDLAVGEGAFSSNATRLQNIEAGMEGIGRLLGQLLTYARAEASGSLHDRMESVALDRIAENSASTFLDAALAREVDLGFEIAPATARGIPWLLQEALGNLIDNAIRYTPRGGVVTVRCGETEGGSFLEVEDDGPGIPEEYARRVFERFYRIPGSPSGGCGLGLPIVQEIAELHGAEIRLLPGQPKGQRVRLCFPGGVPPGGGGLARQDASR